MFHSIISSIYQKRQVGRQDERQSCSYITGTHAHIPYRRGIQFCSVNGHDGIAGTNCELAHHQECDLQPEYILASLGDCGTAAGDAGTEQCATEEPLLAHLGDNVHGHRNGRYFD